MMNKASNVESTLLEKDVGSTSLDPMIPRVSFIQCC
jgi:hypothetical protein